MLAWVEIERISKRISSPTFPTSRGSMRESAGILLESRECVFLMDLCGKASFSRFEDDLEFYEWRWTSQWTMTQQSEE